MAGEDATCTDLLNSTEGEEMLIYLVKENGILWNTKLKEYKNNKIKEIPWLSIAEKLKSEVEDVKSKWKCMRDKYVREKKIMTKLKRSGAGKVTRKSWIFMESLQFLDDSLSHRNTVSNMDEIDEGKNTEATTILEDLANGGSYNALDYDESPTSSKESPRDNGIIEAEKNMNTKSPKTVSLNSRTNSACSLSSASNPPKKKKMDAVEGHLVDIIAKHSNDVDPTKQFLLSLMPDMNKIPKSKLLRVKIQMLKLIEENIDNDSDI